jgi:hypothetical protein
MILTREQIEKCSGLMTISVNTVDLGGSLTHVGVDLALKLLVATDAALRAQLAQVTAERDKAQAVAAALVPLAPITEADVRWAKERLTP